MTDNPIPPPPDAEPLVHVGWWCWRGDNHGHLATMACRSDNVPIHVPAEWADEMRAVIRRIEDGDDEDPAVLPAVPVPPTTHATDRADLRDRTAEAVHRAMHPSRSWTRQSDEIREQCFQAADEVLAELPPSASQDSASADEVAHALDNATPYPIELDSALCRFMAERLLEMLAIIKRTQHAVWQPDEEPPPGPQPQPEDPSNLPDEEASRD